MAEIGIYEKALPKALSWLEKLTLVKELGFDFLEFSIDESAERLARLSWTAAEIAEVRWAVEQTGIPLRTLMLSAHRRYPLGAQKLAIQKKSLEIGKQAINLCEKLGIRHIQLAGYDVFYEEKSVKTREAFMMNLATLVKYAATKDVMLDLETMDDPFINSLEKIYQIKRRIKSPWLQAYPDLGNLSAWSPENVATDIEQHVDLITHVHLKDSFAVTADYPGKFKDVPFGSGVVDFDGLFQLLTNLDYDGCYTIEMWSEEDDEPLERIREAQAFFSPLFEKYQIRGNKRCWSH
ncbi:L-ribulose-5-phosphate 3-epimerase [Vagococcus sp. BWB3-3]|uniref:L-ribulose-5-phosphate 3-epimerase n=1 Tax=Vagococcus allomyrinae TaxID=2794353 RepID=A0A940STV4_9ENTE|nr:L-ribulose-5-phosphate 3-epimerase [Vagococcus allomyrinae]